MAETQGRSLEKAKLVLNAQSSLLRKQVGKASRVTGEAGKGSSVAGAV